MANANANANVSTPTMFAASLIVAAHQLNSPPIGHHNLSPLQTTTVQGNIIVASAPAPAALISVPAPVLSPVSLPVAALIEQGLELRQYSRNDTTDDGVDDDDDVIGPVAPPPLPAGSLLAMTSTPSSPSRRRRWQFSRVPVVSEYVVPEVTTTAASSEEQSHQHQGSESGERISLDLEMARLAIFPGGINDSNGADCTRHDDEDEEHTINESTVDNVFDAMGRDDRTRVYRRLVGMQHRLVELTRLWGQRLVQVGRQNSEQEQSARNMEYPPPRPQPPVPAPVSQSSNARNPSSAERGNVNTNVIQPISTQRFVTVERSSNRIITTPYTADVPVSPELGPSSGLFKSGSSNSPFRNLNTGRGGTSSSARALHDVDRGSTAAQRSSCFSGILVKIFGRKRPDPVQQNSPGIERPTSPVPPVSSTFSHPTHESNRVLDGGQVLESERVQESVHSHRSDGTPGREQTCEDEQAQENTETNDGELTRKATNLMRANALL